MTKLLLSALACFAFVATTSSVFADNNEPVPQQQGQQNPQNGEPQQNPQQNPQ